MSFPFLSQPPPKRVLPAALPAPPCSPPPVPDSNNIAAWAAHVQPGSPAPLSPPYRRPSITRRSSITSSLSLTRRRRPTHGRAPSGSFIHLVHTPTRTTPSVAEFDLTALGYTSVFVHLDKTPTTPSAYIRTRTPGSNDKPTTPLTGSVFGNIPIPPIPQHAPAKRVGMKRFRSLSILRTKKSKQQSVSPAPAPAPALTTNSKSTSTTSSSKPTPSSSKPKPTSRARSYSTAEIHSASIAQRKHAQYKYAFSKNAKSKHPALPPTLANELALMQFADGGSMEGHVKRLMDAQAKAALGTHAHGSPSNGNANGNAGVGTVHRDAHGGIWWDADEEMEYTHLLNDGCAFEQGMDLDWEEEFKDVHSPLPSFPPSSHTTPSSTATAAAANPAVDLLRRESTTSTSTSASILKHTQPLPLPEDDPLPHDRVLSSTRIGGAGMSVLALPSRARRRAGHLAALGNANAGAGKSGYLVGADAEAFWVPRTPKSPSSPKSPRSPRSPRTPLGFTVTNVHGMGMKAKAAAAARTRRRPAPLTLASSAHARANAKVALVGVRKSPSSSRVHGHGRGHGEKALKDNSEKGNLEQARKEFIDDSFVPLGVPSQQQVQPSPIEQLSPLDLSPLMPAYMPTQQQQQQQQQTQRVMGFVAVQPAPAPAPQVKKRGMLGLFSRGS